jgi:transposase
METLRLTLEAIADKDPQWLKRHVPTDWLHTYGRWTQSERLVRGSGPSASAQIRRLLLQTGQDGFTLLDTLEAQDAATLRELPAVGVLRTVWSQQYQRNPPTHNQPTTSVTSLEANQSQNPQGPGGLPEDSAPALPPRLDGPTYSPTTAAVQTGVQMLPASAVDAGQRGNIMVTPHDPQARRATKGAQAWNGYKLHLTETAAEDSPLLITDLEVGAAATYDCHCLDPVQQRLQERDLLPDTRLADAGYVNGPTMHRSRKRQVELLGPVPADTYGASRQESILPAEAFQVDVENRQAICPGGHPNQRWSVYHRRGGEDYDLMAIIWDKQVCGGCSLRGRCLPPGQDQRTLRLSRYYDLLSARRREQTTEAFRERYRRRAGIEATFSHLVNVHGARRTPYRGPDKTLGYYGALCVGVNLRRVAAWQAGRRPRRQRSSALSRLVAEHSAEGTPGAAP